MLLMASPPSSRPCFYVLQFFLLFLAYQTAFADIRETRISIDSLPLNYSAKSIWLSSSEPNEYNLMFANCLSPFEITMNMKIVA
ncbi:hypothetical protein AMTRI_Chr10g180 [Amborella trichopoda]